jgi:polysaccharide biosynthesis/export protein
MGKIGADMKKGVMTFTMIWAMLVFLCPVVAYAQAEKGSLSKKQAQAEVVSDSNQYVIGPEDSLYVHVWKEENLSRTVPVRVDGKISLPLIDEIQAAGLTPLQLKENLVKKFREFVDIPNVSVIVMEANSFKVFVSGYVKTPGAVRLRSETTILQVISMVGGFTEWANQKKVLVIRKEEGKEKRITVNYKKIVGGDEPNLVLKSGDTIIVP